MDSGAEREEARAYDQADPDAEEQRLLQEQANADAGGGAGEEVAQSVEGLAQEGSYEFCILSHLDRYHNTVVTNKVPNK